MTNDAKPSWTLCCDGDSAVVVTFDNRVDLKVNTHCVVLAEALRQVVLSGVRDVVEGYATVTVHHDPRKVTSDTVLEKVREMVLAVETRYQLDSVPSGQEIALPVCYGGKYGPDIVDVAAFGQCSEADVIRLHSGRNYRVYMLGFQPGFAYLGSVDGKIAAPRRSEPRVQVPAGSVGIAGKQTGVYPSVSPGGWQIIGRSPAALCDWTRDPPFLLSPGDHVRFEKIDAATYEDLSSESM